ncbi:TlpA family protein disulfide reductase [Candidatus Saganbacteria bacterium]|nr:TlpA family protein disulfide reductase [Candidatus Saganbacteria bacterium]
MDTEKLIKTALFLCFYVSLSLCFCVAMSGIKTPATDFTLKDLNNNSVKLSDYKGKVVLLNFFATWCPPCREEMPSIEKLHKNLKNKKFAVLAVAIDKKGEPAVRPFIEKEKYTFKVLLDSKNKVSDVYGIQSIPATYVINKKGIIVDKVIGSFDWTQDKVVRVLEGLIKEK